MMMVNFRRDSEARQQRAGQSGYFGHHHI